MRAIGHQIEVVTLDSPAAPWVTGFGAPAHGLGPSVGSYGYSSRFVPWLRQHASDYDAIFVRGMWQYHSFGTWCALHGSKFKYFVFSHGMLDPWSKRRYPIKTLRSGFIGHGQNIAFSEMRKRYCLLPKMSGCLPANHFGYTGVEKLS